jgi:hypothetical protein
MKDENGWGFTTATGIYGTDYLVVREKASKPLSESRFLRAGAVLRLQAFAV